jgi:hypothetical protein
MLASEDHGKSWFYLGSPLSVKDAALLGPYTRLANAGLLVVKGNIYLSAVFGNANLIGTGTFIIPFKDAGTALLKRNENNTPLTDNFIQPTNTNLGPMGIGGSTYSAECKTGMMVTEQEAGSEKFKLIRTYKNPLKD